jgi:hypothetical protein
MTRKKLVIAGLLTVIFLSIVSNDVYADSEFDIDYCKTISDDTKRLACFDKVVANDSTVQLTWTGTGEQRLPPFNVNGAWTLHWTTEDSGGVTIFVYNDPSTDDYADLSSSNAAGDESSYETVTGTIYLKVNGYGPWKVWVVE